MVREPRVHDCIIQSRNQSSNSNYTNAKHANACAMRMLLERTANVEMQPVMGYGLRLIRMGLKETQKPMSVMNFNSSGKTCIKY